MEYIVKATTSYGDISDQCYQHVSSETVTALVVTPSFSGLRPLCKTVDELNILMDMLSRPDFSDIIKMFGGKISLEEMRRVAILGVPTSADMEEYELSTAYPNWVADKYRRVENELYQERFRMLEKLFSDNGYDGYATARVLAEKTQRPLIPLDSFERKLQNKETFLRKMRALNGATEAEVSFFVNTRVLAEIFLSEEPCRYEEDLNEENPWFDELSNNFNEDCDMCCPPFASDFERDIVVAPFSMPTSGTLVLFENGGYRCFD